MSSHSKDADCESVTSHGDVCVDNLCVACGATPGWSLGGCNYTVGSEQWHKAEYSQHLSTDRDALVTVEGLEAWSTAVERPPEGGTLLATQRWTKHGDEWRIATHRYIPWSADGATAVVALRCDGRGCVLLGREINTRDRRGAVL